MTPEESKLISEINTNLKNIIKNIFKVIFNILTIVGLIIISPVTWIIIKFKNLIKKYKD